MSSQTYQKKCKALFRDAEAELRQDDDAQQITAPNTSAMDVQRKDFQDVTVIRTQTMFGEDEEMRLTSGYAPPQKKKRPKEKRKFDKYALLVRRIVERRRDQDLLIATDLCIQSKTLCTTVREIVRHTYESLDIKSTPIVIPAPFFELFFKKKEIEAYLKDASKADELRAEVKLLHDFMQTEKLTIGRLDEYNALVEQGKISFETMWTLFPPNELLIRNDGAAHECWLCRDVTLHVSKETPLTWQVSGVRLDFNGHEVGLTTSRYLISFARQIDGTMNIAQLPLIPVKYFPGWAKTKTELLKRGTRFQELMGPGLDGHGYRRYDGPLWDECDLYTPPKLKINQRVVVDYIGYLKFHTQEAVVLEREGKAKRSRNRHARNSDDSSDSNSDSDRDSDSDNEESDVNTPSRAPGFDLEAESQEKDPFESLRAAVSDKYGVESMDDLLVLCPARMPGYCLTSKAWGWLLIDRLEPVKPSDAAFQSLQIDANTKDLVMSLVRGHQNSDTDDFDDLISGKGKGLVMLLNGKPGIGKTLTAESIAELTGCPLYNLSGGELSVNVSDVEKKLEAVFTLAKRWGAIVLLDEADVVMSKRTSSELERNAIVAVWLRMLEYFGGILFLTSNRRDEFDEAFHSRIHLTINLPDLGAQQRAKIWQGLIEKNKHALDATVWQPEMFVTLGKLNINGRVIKNLLRTAVYHARSCGSRLRISHVYDVIKVEFCEEKNIEEVSRELEQLMLSPKPIVPP